MCLLTHVQGRATADRKLTVDSDEGHDDDDDPDSVSFKSGLQTSTFSNTWRNSDDAQCSSNCSLKLDPYLETPVVAHPILPEVMFVCVPALPRGALVEVAAQLLDLAGLGACQAQHTKGGSGDDKVWVS